LNIVDGNLFKDLHKTVEELWYNQDKKDFKDHRHYEVLKGVTVSDQINNGNKKETNILEENLKAGRIYVLD
jgi:hypothetical protein